MTPRGIGRATSGIFVILSATAAALGLFARFGIEDIAILSVVGGGVFYATMRLIDRSPT
jgi:hypothetical protein